MSRSRRLEEIIRQRRQRQQQAPRKKQQTGLGMLLDQINAFGTLENIVHSLSTSRMAFGPLDIRGTQPQPWTAVVIWHRPHGYHQYRTLGMLGVWAMGTPANAQIIMGAFEREFQASHYNPEAYFHRLPQNFSAYYGKLDQPPSSPALCLDYRPEDRLSNRQQIQETGKALMAQIIETEDD